MTAHSAPTAPPSAAIVASGLCKVYRGRQGRPDKVALDHVDLAIPRGSMFALLGPNGAGKSTFINILAGLVMKTSGQCAIWDYDIDAEPRQSRAAIGVVPQELNVDPFFSARQSLDLQAGLYGVPKRERRTDEILAAIHLTAEADAPARSLSGGMRRRLLIGKAMVHSPPILVLDEPTAGVDVELRHQLWETVRTLNAQGVTILLTTHYLEEAEQLCERVAIIHHGKVVACDTTAALLSRLDSKQLAITTAAEIAEVPAALRPFQPEIKSNRLITLSYRPSVTPIAEILAAVQAAGLGILDLSTEEADLEDIFLALTREKA